MKRDKFVHAAWKRMASQLHLFKAPVIFPYWAEHIAFVLLYIAG